MLQTFARGPDWPGNEQVYAFVATTSQKAAAAAFGCSTYELKRWGGTTSNARDIEAAMTAPGEVFVRTLNDTYLARATYLPAKLTRNCLHVAKRLDDDPATAL